MPEAVIDTQIDARLPIDDFLAWMEAPENGHPYSKHTVRAYKRVLRDFAAYFGEMGGQTPQEVNSLVVRGFLGKVQGIRSAATVSLARNALSAFMDWCWGNGQIEGNPVKDMDRGRPHGRRGGRKARPLPSVIYAHEAARMFDLLAENDTRGRLRDLALCGFVLDTGFRVSEVVEVCAYQWEPLASGDPKAVLHITGKGQRDRVVPPLAAYRWVVNDYLEYNPPASPQAPLFRSLRAGRALSESTVYRATASVFAAAGVSPKRQRGPHVLRHTAASRMLAAGINIRAVQEYLGHSSIQTTEQYLHLL